MHTARLVALLWMGSGQGHNGRGVSIGECGAGCTVSKLRSECLCPLVPTGVCVSRLGSREGRWFLDYWFCVCISAELFVVLSFLKAGTQFSLALLAPSPLIFKVLGDMPQ